MGNHSQLSISGSQAANLGAGQWRGGWGSKKPFGNLSAWRTAGGERQAGRRPGSGVGGRWRVQVDEWRGGADDRVDLEAKEVAVTCSRPQSGRRGRLRRCRWLDDEEAVTTVEMLLLMLDSNDAIRFLTSTNV